MRGVLASLLLAALGALAVPGVVAAASDVIVEITAPEEARVGDEVEIRVALRSASDGDPIADADVALYGQASFGGVTGDVVLARTATDEDGVALLAYEPRTAGELELRLEYTAPGAAEPETAPMTISVAEGPQLHRSTAGIQVPGLNVWLLIAVLSAVWGILFIITLIVIGIARAGVDPAAASPVVAGQMSEVEDRHE